MTGSSNEGIVRLASRAVAAVVSEDSRTEFVLSAGRSRKIAIWPLLVPVPPYEHQDTERGNRGKDGCQDWCLPRQLSSSLLFQL